jgi:hypothetical protein
MLTTTARRTAFAALVLTAGVHRVPHRPHRTPHRREAVVASPSLVAAAEVGAPTALFDQAASGCTVQGAALTCAYTLVGVGNIDPAATVQVRASAVYSAAYQCLNVKTGRPRAGSSGTYRDTFRHTFENAAPITASTLASSTTWSATVPAASCPKHTVPRVVQLRMEYVQFYADQILVSDTETGVWMLDSFFHARDLASRIAPRRRGTQPSGSRGRTAPPAARRRTGTARNTPERLAQPHDADHGGAPAAARGAWSG